MRKFFIYALINPTSNKPFYVGSTASTLARRLALHVWSAKYRPHGRVSEYIRHLPKRPLIVSLEIVKNATSKGARAREAFWLNQLKSEGFELLNQNKPLDDYTSPMMQLSKEEIGFLKAHSKYASFIADKYDLKISPVYICKVARGRGTVKGNNYNKIQKFIELVKSEDLSRIAMTHRTPVIILTDQEVERIGKSRLLLKNCNDGTLRRAIETKTLRLDTYKNVIKSLNTLNW